jgi:hypothetical protein
MSFLSNGGKFKLYTIANGLLFSTPTQLRFSFERMILCTPSGLVDLQVISNKRDQIFWLKLFDKNKKERVAILGSTLHASKISSCHFTLHASAHDRLFGGYYIFKYC